MKRTADSIVKLIGLYQTQVKALEASNLSEGPIGKILAWYSCKVAIADLYEELQAARIGNVERINATLDRRRNKRGNAA